LPGKPFILLVNLGMAQPSVQKDVNETNRFEALFNHASMGIVVISSSGSIQSVNPFALNLFGYSIYEIIDMPIEVLIPERYHPKHADYRKNYICHPGNRPMGVGMDLFAVKKDGAEFPVEISLGNYQNNGEQNVIAFISDISVRKKAEAEIKKLNNELETTVQGCTKDLKETLRRLEIALEKEKDLNELKSRFVSMASHEFRTPLSTVLSSAYLIQKYTTSSEQPQREKHLQRIVSSVSMLTDILNDFLSVGKIEEGKIQVRNTEFNIQELVISIAGEIKGNLKKQQKIQCHHEGNPEVYLDVSLLKHSIMNLVSNASKFSPEVSPIEIKTSTGKNHIILSVKDHGMGISKEDQRHLMERFFRGSNVSTIQGTGLGLHIISKYAELMNGTIECNSELGKGTEFKIIFTTKVT
jgi:PAS domain S-box-containing protein